MNDFFSLYDTLIDEIPESSAPVTRTAKCRNWTLIETASSSGISMTTGGDSVAPLYPGGFTGLSLKDAAKAAKSWNFSGASFGHAAINAYYNTKARLEESDWYLPIENHYTWDMDFSGKTVGVIGHMHITDEMHRAAEKVFVLERSPQPGDYPDSACDFILPQCDIIIITGSSLINKTLPHLLEINPDAYTILTGGSVPMCPALLDHGIDMLAGLVLTEREAVRDRIERDDIHSPYGYGMPFVIKKQ